MAERSAGVVNLGPQSTIDTYRKIALGELEGHVFADGDGNQVHLWAAEPGTTLPANAWDEAVHSAKLNGVNPRDVVVAEQLMDPATALLRIMELKRNEA